MNIEEDKKLASALSYNGSSAPQVIAKGSGEAAEHIITSAKQNDVPIIEDHTLSQVLQAVPLGDEIPENLYIAVAEILVHVYHLEGKYRSYR
ncbi:MAG: type III secretion protein [Gammaproteobacteria bacterium]|nr:MAG: type III secretion protein [Gammaproteobacteria bacterium]